MRRSEIDAVPCPVARALSVVGDTWTILILRDCFRGATRFDAFLTSTRAPRAVLSERLGQLVAAGILEKAPYGGHSRRFDYTLTSKGHALQPVLMTLSTWSERWMPDPAIRKLARRHTACGRRFTPVMTCSECGEAIRPGEVTYDPRSGEPTHAPAALKVPGKIRKTVAAG